MAYRGVKMECTECGKILIGNQRKFCSKSCCGKNNRKKVKISICEVCGAEYEVKNWRQKFCSKSCSAKRTRNSKCKDEDLNRPYTSETKYLILMWHRKGNSKVEIAQILGRSLESVEKAFV